ncbi:hypothetical protein CLOM_g9394 [Closterium sp. NIES-68]|nr:hypothetical protein CLOM_g9394 [Closterium sp. NIES-68]GJP64538.1 hypothetical protein CLOP_g21514 [Closterium sp. NIES-67]
MAARGTSAVSAPTVYASSNFQLAQKGSISAHSVSCSPITRFSPGRSSSAISPLRCSFLQPSIPLRPQPGNRAKHPRRFVVSAAGKQTFSSFDDMIQSADVVLVDFYATWCGPCQIVAKTLDQVSAQVGNSVKIVKVDTEKYPKLASRYGIQGLPTLMLFRKGQVIDRVEGALSAQDLLMRMNYMLSTSK